MTSTVVGARAARWMALLAAGVGLAGVAAVGAGPSELEAEAPIAPLRAQRATLPPPAPATPSTPRVADAGPTAQAPPLAWYLEPIVSRNLFDSTPAVSPAAGETPAPAPLVASELPIELIATNVATDSTWSTALVRRPNESSFLVRIGAPLQDAVVHDILRPGIGPDGALVPARLIVERAGALEYLEEDNKPPRVVKKKKKKKRTRKRTRRAGKR